MSDTNSTTPSVAEAPTPTEAVLMTQSDSRQQSTIEGYSSAATLFLVWIYHHRNYVDYLRPSWRNPLNGLRNDPQKKKWMAQKLQKVPVDQDDPPMDFKNTPIESFNTMFLNYSGSFRKPDGDYSKEGSTFDNYAKGYKWLVKLYGATLKEGRIDGWESFIKGVKTKKAKKRLTGEKVEPGKDHFDSSDYYAISRYFLETGQPDTHFYSVAMWDLGGRSENIGALHCNHLIVEEDAIGVAFPTTKPDQEGTRSHITRACYANPDDPSVCFNTSLGIHLLCNRPTGPLFLGPTPKDTYSDQLATCLNSDIIVKIFSMKGKKPKDYGVHSFRKGNLTYVSNGTTASPANSTIRVRAGWKATMYVENIYEKFDKGGDQYVGRVAAMLPIGTSRFGLLPPYFKDDPYVDTTVVTLFEGVACSLAVCRRALASVVYNWPRIKPLIRESHPIYKTGLFTRDLGEEKTKLEKLQEFVVFNDDWNNDPNMKATGIPPYVFVLKNQQDIIKKQDELLIEMGKMIPGVVDGVRDVLDDTGATANTATRDFVLQQFNELREMMMNTAPITSVQPSSDQEENVEPPRSDATYFYDGRFSRLPEDFPAFLKSLKVRDAFRLYCQGGQTPSNKSFPPLRKLDHTEFKERTDERRRFCDLQNLMKVIVTELRDKGLWKEGNVDFTDQDVITMWNAGKHVVTLPPQTKKGQKRRNELAWRTVYNQLPKRRRRGGDA